MRIVEKYPLWYRMVRGDGAWAILTPLRFIISRIYGLYLAVRRDVAEGGISSAGKGPFIITIGNIEAGGLGKTPVALEIAGRLKAGGSKVVIVTRGYRSLAERSGKSVILFPEGISPYAAPEGWIDARTMLQGAGTGGSAFSPSMVLVAGDEAVLFAQRGIPVVIDKDRSRGIEKAAEVFSPDHILLDDAFQRRDVRADMTILLLDAGRPFGNGHLIPMGTLRENVSSIERADVVILTRAHSTSISTIQYKELQNIDIYTSMHRSIGLFDRDGERQPVEDLAGREFIIFSGIARPGSFERSVEETGLAPFLSFRFIDHHRYRTADIDMMRANAPEGAVYITTEKDIGKVRDMFPATDILLTLRIITEIEGIEGLIGKMTASQRG